MQCKLLSFSALYTMVDIRARPLEKLNTTQQLNTTQKEPSEITFYHLIHNHYLSAWHLLCATLRDICRVYFLKKHFQNESLQSRVNSVTGKAPNILRPTRYSLRSKAKRHPDKNCFLTFYRTRVGFCLSRITFFWLTSC